MRNSWLEPTIVVLGMVSTVAIICVPIVGYTVAMCGVFGLLGSIFLIPFLKG